MGRKVLFGLSPRLRCGPVWDFSDRQSQDEVRRTPLPRTRVNRGLRGRLGPPTILAVRRSVGKVDDARRERLRVHELQRLVLTKVLEEAFAAAHHQGVDHELELVE